MTTYQEEFRKGEQRAKIRNPKQAIITGGLQGLVIALALFNDFPIFLKILLFLVLQFILGAIMPSDWMQKKLKAK